ncbi:TPA: hypothetical protein DEQ22_01730 [Candidatus Nomurabacteria bacterium]|uniref:Endolytic murein transglycosylase n=1 Tax=Candidatus Nomurabacteria bacterium RIFOXYA2_FULL_42_12 TaxID=1801801 RepID=A0A1F6YKS7_9BACT|nr:MAG: hypothetical protein A2740_02050 [Candidatus Nomurabacteria bacterium RIFCSPHIGHO2_01_FULL_43_16]OGI97937.1 MAG: hypothetical protein A3A11_00195 [Candidatus Nomurabacteria bacterium RIFCSPLOWO2_01_FULL_43_15]OGJ04645.1 MAG: hypothetical protein A2357_03425 [Candidatus Nomurabacteria bacterium RIFOXYB1_FULL_43_14]OGJ06983.1 MAG: hypothetical protein A2225_03195 [Candidatus Nomurabacteria bacterium RIFOXYA2_FULL_42_12]OGJ07136.1 MAG: hypothetical protein A2183_01655 [Candidatus Nomurabac
MENPLNEFALESGQPAPRLDGMRRINFYLLGAVTFLVLCYFFFLSAPGNFPPGAVIRVEKGSSLRSVSAVLKKEHIIRSRVAFESLVIILGGEKRIVSADYLFENKLPVWEVALRIRWGKHFMAPVSVTIPEGFDVKQIGDTFASKLTNFNKARFLLKAESKEGYLFPDTYFFLTDADEDDVLRSMTDNFNKKIVSLSGEIASSGKTEKDIIIMSSIIEREAKGNIDREVISGILWKRLKIGMPLQADAAPETYKTKGLPEAPISNPGILSIKAAIYPKSSPYLYYLHDKNGNIHYAKSFSEHEQNILKYLK